MAIDTGLALLSPDVQIKKTVAWLKNSFSSHAKAQVSSADVSRSMSTARTSDKARISLQVKFSKASGHPKTQLLNLMPKLYIRTAPALK